MGLIEAGGMAQPAAGQIGGRSIELSQSSCMAPSTQRQAQAAQALAALNSPVNNIAKSAVNSRRMAKFQSRNSGSWDRLSKPRRARRIPAKLGPVLA
jgi:hypothetical protein